ncbi:MAG: carbamoylphosphate synthase large subunit, partial [Candidatus Faecivivens sp.]|nr:carbamoylphosphate synthase large subunit [Candidatus Faecivivens sp.]
MNVIFISPGFPRNYEYFCAALAENGATVLGIGDEPYDELSGSLKASLTEYYKVGSMENYDEMVR